MVHFIEPSSDQLKVMLNHFHSIGADDHILTEDDSKNKMILQKWFYQLVIRNNYFPMDLPVEFTLQQYFEAILQNEVPLKGFNLKAHIEAFERFMEEQEPAMRARWWRLQHPNQRPKSLPESASISEEEATASAVERSATLKNMFKAEGVPEHLKKYMEEE